MEELSPNPNRIDQQAATSVDDSLAKQSLKEVLASSARRDSPVVKRWLAKHAPQLAALPHRLQVACALQHLDRIPSCPIVPSEEVLFLTNRFSFAPVGKTAWALVKHDMNIETPWLTWFHLLQHGLSLSEGQRLLHEKGLFFAREFFTKTETIVDVQQRLISDGFTVERAKTLVSELDLENFASIKLFINEIQRIKKIRNIEIDYFIERGHDITAARLLLREFFTAGPSATRKKVTEDAEYAAWFRSTRLPGLAAQGRHSAMEIAIKGELEARGFTVEKRITHISARSRLSQEHDRSWFCHDFYVPQLNAIIEYNGVYWHPDRSFELQKAAYVIAVTGCRYMMLWEKDHVSAVSYVDWILQSTEAFSSTDPDDVISFKLLLRASAKETRYDATFLDIADRMAKMSHCQSKKVAALAVLDTRIVGTGINGSITGGVNCDEVFPDGVDENNREEHRAWSRFNEVHAEENLIGDAASRGGVGLRGCTVYSSLQPCQKCSTYLANIGVKRIVYRHSYDMGDRSFSEKLFRQCGIIFDQLAPDGGT